MDKPAESITIKPIGIIHSPYKQTKGMPIQGAFKPGSQAWIELQPQYTAGLKDLDSFSHCILLYLFHKSDQVRLLAKPFLEDQLHGMFAMRSPHRPNHIGVSVVKIENITGCQLHFSEVDMLDQTPVLDIKPYVRYFDMRDNVVSGWIDKHFQNIDGIPGKVILK